MFDIGSLPDETPPPGRFVVTVEKWSGGWDLHIDGDGLNSGGGVTQVTSLDEADAQVRNYLRSVFETDFKQRGHRDLRSRIVLGTRFEAPSDGGMNSR